MHDPFQDPVRDISSLRREVEDRIRCKLHGFYFASNDTILGSKPEDEALLQELCPEDARNNIASDVAGYIFRVLLACTDKWCVLNGGGALSFWKMVAMLGEANSNVRIRPAKTRDLITSLIKARQRYIIRQGAIYSDFDMEGDMRPGCDAAAQAVLERIVALEDPSQFSGDIFRSPLCIEKEKRELLKHTVMFGPVKQISRDKFQLAKGAPQSLHPISDLARRPALSSARGFVEELVSRVKPPAQIKHDGKSPKTTASKQPSTPTRGNSHKLPQRASGAKRKSDSLYATPTRCKNHVTRERSPVPKKNRVEDTPQSRKRIKTGTHSGTQKEPIDLSKSPTPKRFLRSPFIFRP